MYQNRTKYGQKKLEPKMENAVESVQKYLVDSGGLQVREQIEVSKVIY